MYRCHSVVLSITVHWELANSESHAVSSHLLQVGGNLQYEARSQLDHIDATIDSMRIVHRGAACVTV